MPSYKLTYFNVKGKGETIRLAFTAAGIPFEDKRIEGSEWASLKPTIFTGQLPMLEVDGAQLFESTAIARYVAREGGLLGSSSLEQAKIEAIFDAINCGLDSSARVKYAPEGPVKVAVHKDLMEKHLPAIVKLCEKYLGNNKFFVADKLSLADLHFFTVFTAFNEYVSFDWQSISPPLKGLHQRVAENPKIAAYLTKQQA